jgi:hypothetical protein
VAAYQYSMARARERRIASTFLPWGSDIWSETMTVFNNDPMPYGLSAPNQVTIAKLQDYLMEQQLIGNPHSCSDLFWEA